MAQKIPKSKRTERSSSAKDEPPGNLVIGVDFGTTFSSVAYRDFRRNGPVLIEDWGHGKSSHKNVPTVLRRAINSGRTEWGPQVKDTFEPGCVRKECFKLALDPNVWRRYGCVDVGAFRQGLLDSINPEDDIPELCTTYLRELCAQAKKSMRKTLGSAFDRMHKHWVVTVPALWDPAARELIKTCAADAGFEDAEIISEPEAAASYALRDNAHLSDEEAWLREGDSFVVCDVGGITADLITYKLISRARVTVQEVVPAAGGKCGSSFVNRRLERIVQNRIAYQMTLTDENRANLRRQLEKAKYRFSEQPDSLDGIGARIQGLPLSDSDDPAVSISDGCLFLTTGDINWAFDGIIDPIKGLLKSQIDDATRAGEEVRMVLLVGGFAESRYLLDTLDTWLTHSYTGIQLMWPSNPRNATALGAIVKRSIAVARKSTAYIGVESRVHFDEDWHMESKRRYCPVEGRDMCIDVMSWHVGPNEDLFDSPPREFEYTQYRRLKGDLVFQTPIYYSYPKQQRHTDDEHQLCESCRRLASQQSSTDQVYETFEPPYYLDSRFSKKAILTFKPSKVEPKLPIIIGADGKRYYEIQFKIRVTFESALYLKWSVLCQGEEIGRVRCNYP